MIPCRLRHTEGSLREKVSVGGRGFSLPSALGALRHRDFLLFWVGAFVSFMGTWIQNTGQQWLVYDLTGSKYALGLLTFLGSAPLFFLAPVGGWFADRFNKRWVLVVCQSLFALSAFTLAVAVWLDFIRFELIAFLAVLNGVVAVIEIPTRQAMISQIVPERDLGNAIPINSATFNLARIIGPLVGGLLLTYFGAGSCYLINGISFSAIIFAVLAIHSDLRSTADPSASLRESFFEGLFHVWNHSAFRTLVLMMACSSVFGVFYLSMLSAFAKSTLQVGPTGFGNLLTITGVGALVGVVALAFTSGRPWKGWVVLVAMTGFGASLMALSYAYSYGLAMLTLFFVGMFGLSQMVGTNTALQFFSPPSLRGRIVSVHIWTVAGLSPLGSLLFGWISEQRGLREAFLLGGGVVFVFGLVALLFAKSVKLLQ